MLNGYLTDIILAVVFLAYPFFLLIISKVLENLGFRKDLSRKFVHAAMGIVILFIPLFHHKWIALIPPIIFTGVNAADMYWGLFSQIEGEDRGNIGTVLYPISFIILISIFYGTQWWGLAVLGVLAMAFGDAGASIIGRQFGKTKYYVNGETRSFAGSGAMFFITYIVCLAVFLGYGAGFGVAGTAISIFAASFVISSLSTIIEALSIKGSDNLTVPVLTAIFAWLILAHLVPAILGNQAIVNQPIYQ